MSATNPSAVGLRSVKPSTTGLQSGGAKYTHRAERQAKNSNEKGERFTGKQLKSAIGDYLKSSKAASDALEEGEKALKIARDAGNDDIAAMLEEACAMLIDKLNEIAAHGVELADMMKDELAGQPDAEDFETNTGEVPSKGATAGALDSAAMDAGVQVIRAHGMDVSMTHVATVDAATRLQAEQADWKKSTLQAAIVDGADPVEVNRIRHGLARPTSTDPVGDFNKRFGSK